MTEFVFGGIADAIRPEGFGAICRRACDFISVHYGCRSEFNPTEFRRAYRCWVDLAVPLPLNDYKSSKRNLVCVAVLIQAVATCHVAKFYAQDDMVSDVPVEYPREVLAIVMGLILHNIALRTERVPITKIHYVPLENLNATILRDAVSVMREKTGTNHRRRFTKLMTILKLFRTPITFH